MFFFPFTQWTLAGVWYQVAVDISLSAHANARTYFDAKKKCAAKEDKTKAATTKALKSAQRKADTDLRKEVTARGRGRGGGSIPDPGRGGMSPNVVVRSLRIMIPRTLK